MLPFKLRMDPERIVYSELSPCLSAIISQCSVMCVKDDISELSPLVLFFNNIGHEFYKIGLFFLFDLLS